MTYRVALYSRVSTLSQTVDPQLMELRAYCASKGWAIAHEFTDTISGTKADREGLNKMMELVRSKSVDAVCAVKLDRMARSLHHFCNLAAEFVKHDVALICTGQGIDTSKGNACGQLQMNVIACIAQFERALISERTKAGLVVARAAGKKIGNQSIRMPKSKEERAQIVQAWLARNGSYEDLGAALGGVSRATAWRLARKLVPTLAAPPPPVEVEI